MVQVGSEQAQELDEGVGVLVDLAHERVHPLLQERLVLDVAQKVDRPP